MIRRQVKFLCNIRHISSESESFFKSLKPLGIGVASFLRCYKPLSNPLQLVLSTSIDLPPEYPLAVIPDTAVWTIENLHDKDVEGLMPSPEICLSIFPYEKEKELFNIFYLALYFSFYACLKNSLWSLWQIQQTSLTTNSLEYENNAKEFLYSLSKISLTPPLEIFLSMVNYTRYHSCYLSQDGTKFQKNGSLLAVIPIIDIALSNTKNEANISLKRCNAKTVRTIIKSYPILSARQCIQTRSDEAGYWLVETINHVKREIPLILHQTQ